MPSQQGNASGVTTAATKREIYASRKLAMTTATVNGGIISATQPTPNNELVLTHTLQWRNTHKHYKHTHSTQTREQQKMPTVNGGHVFFLLCRRSLCYLRRWRLVGFVGFVHRARPEFIRTHSAARSNDVSRPLITDARIRANPIPRTKSNQMCRSPRRVRFFCARIRPDSI